MTSVSPPTYTVILDDPGPHRLQVMRMIREYRPDLGPAAAKAFIDSTPQVVLSKVDYYDVDYVRHRLGATGARVSFHRN